ncbi:MAG: hypothetical protein EON58_14655 [Alphaproteobacteria bacterium]|nr:MAG: hypothetical protein EON58_14655 [Alphaproteobacteria bacterium]
MSITKSIWVEHHPEYADARRHFHDRFFNNAEAFRYRLQDTKFERATNGKRRRNPWWSWAVSKALKELALEIVCINGGIFFRTQAERDRVKELAERYMTDGPAALLAQATQKSRTEYLRSRFEKRMHSLKKMPDAEIATAKKAGIDCPLCGYPMKIRTAAKGANIGQRFMGCSLFPSCKGKKRIPTTLSC